MEFLILILALIVYFIPSFNSYSRGQRSRGGVFLFNLFFGWTILGWVIALIWSAS